MTILPTVDQGKEVARAILEHVRAGGEDPKDVLEKVVTGEMVVIPWTVGQLWLVYNSPSGL